jgi:transposase
MFLTNSKLLGEMLGLTPPWVVEDLAVDHENLQVTIRVGCKAGTVWAEKGRQLPIHGYEERRWQHLFAFQYTTWIVAKVPRVRIPEKPDKKDKDDDGSAPTGKRGKFRTELVTVPWASGARVSYTSLFERHAITVAKMSRSLSDAARLLRISWDKMDHIIERAVERGMARRSDGEVIVAAGIDEKAFKANHHYATLLCDLRGKRLLDMADGKTEEAASELIAATLTPEQREGVKAVTMDFCASFKKAAATMLPKAAVLFDRFHVSYLFNKAMSEVRRSLQRELKEEGQTGDELKGLRFLILSNVEDLNEEQTARLDAALKENERLCQAWEAKESFHLVWECQNREDARVFFEKWHEGVKQLPGLRPIKRAAKTIKENLEGVLNWLEFKLTNAFVEGLNSLVQVVKSSARGFRNFESFRSRMLFHFGGLNLMP